MASQPPAPHRHRPERCLLVDSELRMPDAECLMRNAEGIPLPNASRMSRNLRAFIRHPSSLIRHPPSLISHPSSLISHPSSRISHPSSRISQALFGKRRGRIPNPKWRALSQNPLR